MRRGGESNCSKWLARVCHGSLASRRLFRREQRHGGLPAIRGTHVLVKPLQLLLGVIVGVRVVAMGIVPTTEAAAAIVADAERNFTDAAELHQLRRNVALLFVLHRTP